MRRRKINQALMLLHQRPETMPLQRGAAIPMPGKGLRVLDERIRGRTAREPKKRLRLPEECGSRAVRSRRQPSAAAGAEALSTALSLPKRR